VIKTKTEYQEALAQVEKLFFKANRTPEEEALYDLLVMLVERYETENHNLEKPTVAELIKHLMDAKGIQTTDLESVLGSAETTHKLINNQILPTPAQAAVLGSYFSVSAKLFEAE
jgi:HTH-type transcriptional regulator/antitoxin HigA